MNLQAYCFDTKVCFHFLCVQDLNFVILRAELNMQQNDNNVMLYTKGWNFLEYSSTNW